METKKRKYNEISKHNLSIKKVEYLPCEICKCKVYHYKFCTIPYVYCSYDCYAILALSLKNDYLDVQLAQGASSRSSAFAEDVKTWVDMKRTKSEEDLTGLDFDKR